MAELPQEQRNLPAMMRRAAEGVLRLSFRCGAASTGQASAGAHSLSLACRPLPQPVRYRCGQTLPELPSGHDDLPPMMRFMGHEVRQDVTDIERQVPPDVGWRRRHLALGLEPEREDRLDAFATPPERREQLTPPYTTQIDERRDLNPMRQAECADPARATIVQVRDEHADRPARGDTGNGCTPEGGGQLLHQVGGDAAIRPPCGEHGGPQIE